jgi:hypothetical protein
VALFSFDCHTCGVRLLKLSRWAWSLITLAVVVLAAITAFHWCFSLPSDSSLQSNFTQHRSDFDAMRTLFQQDQAVDIIWQDKVEMRDPKADSAYVPHSPSELGFPADRFAKYQALLKSTGTKALIRMEDGSIRLGTGGWGFASYGPRWGYEWMPIPPDKDQTASNMKELLQSLHRGSSSNEEAGERYILLGDHWYFWFLMEG